MPLTLTCPKCGSAMRTYERNGVHVDQCEACRGIFLDFGELEAIVRAAAPEPGSPAAQAQPYAQPTYPPQQYPQQPYAPGWTGQPNKRRGGIASLFFSS